MSPKAIYVSGKCIKNKALSTKGRTDRSFIRASVYAAGRLYIDISLALACRTLAKAIMSVLTGKVFFSEISCAPELFLLWFFSRVQAFLVIFPFSAL